MTIDGCISGWVKGAEVNCPRPCFAGLVYCFQCLKEEHEGTRTKVWAPGDEYKVCGGCGDTSPCDVLKLILWIEEAGYSGDVQD